MPIHPEPLPLYRLNWDEISRLIRYERAGNRCEWCGSHNPANNAELNLAALCQRCHNQHDGHKLAQNRKHRAHPSRPNGAALKTLLIAAALLFAACSPPQAGHAPQATATATLANIASYGRVTVSDGSWNMRKAVDNDIDTWWSADNDAPQWLQVDFPFAAPVSKIELVVSQIRPGPASRTLTAKRNGKTVVWHRFDTDHSADGTLFSLKIDPPQPVDNLRILTTRTEGWVAISELRIMASPLATVSIAASGLSQPVYIAIDSVNSGRLFVVEKKGRIRVIKDGILAETPFLDISTRVDTALLNGLLGLAFSPSYAQNGHFYVSYVSADNQNTVSRFSVGPDPDIADPDSEQVVLAFHHPGVHHSVGTLAFGPLDGHLYIAVGDGKIFEPPDVTPYTQDPGSLLGKILRIDVESGVIPYAIPPGNPFVAAPGYAPEIWALGLRNPWGIAFDHQTGALYIPDTGQHTTEEINFQPAASPGGQNYGWPIYEGPLPYLEAQAQQAETFTLPVAHYSHANGCAIVGGAVVDSVFYFADFCLGLLWKLRQGDSGWIVRLVATIERPISSIGRGHDGAIYATGYADGHIYRVVSPKR